MARFCRPFGAGLLLLTLAAAPLRAGHQELKTLESATEAMKALSEIPLKGIPQALVRDAAGVAILPHVVKIGALVDGRFGRGVLLVHEPDGRWSNPVFISLSGGGVGGQAGVEATELVLVFKTRKSLDRALHGKITLGGDMAIAAGPVGRDAEAGTDRPLKADIYSYSRSRGLFVGLSFEGSTITVDTRANQAFYGFPGGRAADVLASRGGPPVVEALKGEVTKMSMPPARPQ
jgi:lipid-binding SYLF domain-containing protein